MHLLRVAALVVRTQKFVCPGAIASLLCAKMAPVFLAITITQTNMKRVRTGVGRSAHVGAMTVRLAISTQTAVLGEAHSGRAVHSRGRGAAGGAAAAGRRGGVGSRPVGGAARERVGAAAGGLVAPHTAVGAVAGTAPAGGAVGDVTVGVGAEGGGFAQT